MFFSLIFCDPLLGRGVFLLVYFSLSLSLTIFHFFLNSYASCTKSTNASICLFLYSLLWNQATFLDLTLCVHWMWKKSIILRDPRKTFERFFLLSVEIRLNWRQVGFFSIPSPTFWPENKLNWKLKVEISSHRKEMKINGAQFFITSCFPRFLSNFFSL